MFFSGSKRERRAAKWTIQIVTVCILIYLGLRHMDAVAGAAMWLADLFEPLILGIVLALVLNVPMCPIERHLFKKKEGLKAQNARRGTAILLSLLLVFGIFLGVAFLVIPEILRAVPLVNDSILGIVSKAALQENAAGQDGFSLAALLSQIDIDWNGVKNAISVWLTESRSSVMEYVIGVAAKASSALMNIAIGLVFSVYILYSKEKLKGQVKRLVRAWLPERVGDGITHVASVCGKSFKNFIAGQTVEAIILGTLCTVGMFLLRLPYAPMVGALVGVTALIPIVGAWTGMIVGSFIILTVEPFKALVFLIFINALQQVEGNIIYPRVVGSSIGLSAIWVLAAITIGGRLAGPIGMFLGVPAASALYTLIKEVTIWKEHCSPKEVRRILAK